MSEEDKRKFTELSDTVEVKMKKEPGLEEMVRNAVSGGNKPTNDEARTVSAPAKAPTTNNSQKSISEMEASLAAKKAKLKALQEGM